MNIRSALAAGLLTLSIGAAVPAAADIGPISPARSACMGQSAGSPCTIDGKAGACDGPHPSRMTCVPGAAAKGPSGTVVPDASKPKPGPKPAPAPDAAPMPAPDAAPAAAPPPPPVIAAPVPAPAPAAPAPAPAAPAPAPAKAAKSGCAVAGSDGGVLVLLGAAFALGRSTRRRRHGR